MSVTTTSAPASEAPEPAGSDRPGSQRPDSQHSVRTPAPRGSILRSPWARVGLGLLLPWGAHKHWLLMTVAVVMHLEASPQEQL